MDWWMWMLLASLALAVAFGAGWVAASVRHRVAVDLLAEAAAPGEVDQAWADYEAALFETERS